MNINSFFFKFLVYYPTTILRMELPYFIQRKLTKTQYLSTEQIKSIQVKRLAALVKHARETTVFYGNLPQSSIEGLDDIRQLPVIDKEILRNNNDQFLSSKFCGLTASKTSGGSTGAPITVIKNNFGMANEFAATWRGYEWAGVGIGDKQARFWGVPMERGAKIKSKLIDFVTNRLRVSAFAFSDEDMERYAFSLKKFKPIYFYGYVSMIKEFAQFVRRNGYEKFFNIRCVITTSEVLTEEDRKFISSTFNCPVFNEYGCGEIGTIAHECEKGSLHISAENMIVEILDDTGNPVAPGQPGELVVTDLVNYSMPLIRYRMKDFGSISPTFCECGRGLPVLQKVYGRSYDMILNKDGKKFHGEFFLYMIEDIKKKGIVINGYQVEQSSPNKLTISIVANEENFEITKNLLTSHIREKFDKDVNIEFLRKNEIAREASGKLRVIKGMIR